LLLMITVILMIGSPAMAAASQVATPTGPATQDSIAYQIYPEGGHLGDFFRPIIEAGKTKKLTVILANTGSAEFSGRTYAVNAYTAVNGGFEAAPHGTPPQGATRWLDYPEKVYTIPSGKGIKRTFTIKVPAGTAPGQYLCAIALQNAEASAVAGSSALTQVVRFPMPVFITVPGPEDPGFNIGAIGMTSAETYAQLKIVIANTGNIRVRPAGMINLFDTQGQKLYSAPVSMGSVFAHDSTSLMVSVPPLAPGNYQITVDLRDPETKVAASGKATVTATAPATPPPPPPVQLESASATPLPDADHVQFLDVKVTISNSGEDLTNVKVVLHAEKDGKPVEDFALNSSLSVPNGETPIEARYLPATGWSSGEWSFTLSVEAVKGGNGVAQVLATADLGSLTIA
jgi:hypothetical protein